MKIYNVFTCFALALSPVLLLAQPSGASGSWDLIFEDNFNGSTLDNSKWSVNYPWGNGHTHNHEAWCVAEQVSIQNGMLRITATDQKHPDSEAGYDWTSGIITSSGKFHMDEGFIEGRFRMPSTLGTWPAFWTLGNGWPPEIDILEVPHERNVHHYYLHYTNSSGSEASFGGTHTGPDKSAGWHTYGVEWDIHENYMYFYFDGSRVASFNNRSEVAQAVNQYILINLAVGGWAGAPPAGAQFPTYFDCDWVRAWQKSSGGGGGITSGQTYRINVRNSGRALDAGGTANNSPVQVYDYWGGANQRWTVTSTSGGYYRLTNVASGRALDAGGTANNSPVQIYDYWGGNNQQWTFNDLGNGYYSIVNRASGRALDINGTANNSPCIIYDYWGGQNQQFQLTPVGTGSRSAAEQTVMDKAAEDFLIYPNPAGDRLNLTLPEGYRDAIEIQVINSVGQVMLTKTGIGSASPDLDLKVLNAGVYFVKISNGVNALTQKFIKK